MNSTEKTLTWDRKDLPRKVHFVGVGGIGMSGLAQLMAAEGAVVSGSDRGLELPENRRILNSLEAQGIKLFPQDGSYIELCRPDALVYSTAIEDDNPDFACAVGIPRLHRSEALTLAMLNRSGKMLAVAGSSGKTTVTSWLAETLFLLQKSPSFLSGGLVNSFSSKEIAGNFFQGEGDLFVFEADESDKSLLNYSPDYSMILNIGIDHYSHEELIEVFREFMLKTQKGLVIEESVLKSLDCEIPDGIDVKVFSSDIAGVDTSKADWKLTAYSVSEDGCFAEINNKLTVKLPAPGLHTAANALAIIAMLNLLGMEINTSLEAVSAFKGVWRRFDYAGLLETGARVYDDYAHNVQKIISSISAAREITPGKVVTLFQPHGYGPLGFMKDELFSALEEHLSDNDIFAFMPVFYAGGTSSFKPTSEDVLSEYSRIGKKSYFHFSDREEAEKYLYSSTQKGDTVIIMGARDNSLSDWAFKLGRI